MGLAKRYYSIKNIYTQATVLDFQSFDLYMISSDIIIYSDKDGKKVHEEYLKADVTERQTIYERIKNEQLVQ